MFIHDSRTGPYLGLQNFCLGFPGQKSPHLCATCAMWQTHAEYTKITVWVTHACKSTAGSACARMSPAQCLQRGPKVCRRLLHLLSVCCVADLHAHHGNIWGCSGWTVEYSGKKKKGRKRSLKHFRSQVEQIPSRDGGTVEKPRFTVALPRGKTSFRHKPCGKLPRAADLWGQTNKKETVQVIRAEALDPCLH